MLLIDITVIKYLAIEKTKAFRVRIIYLYNCWFLLKYCSFLISCFAFLVSTKIYSSEVYRNFSFFWSLVSCSHKNYTIFGLSKFSNSWTYNCFYQALVFWIAINSISPSEGLKFPLQFLFLRMEKFFYSICNFCNCRCMWKNLTGNFFWCLAA